MAESIKEAEAEFAKGKKGVDVEREMFKQARDEIKAQENEKVEDASDPKTR
jgi:hypothetical protein